MRKLREFVGKLNFYRRFILRWTGFLQPLTGVLCTVTGASTPIVWTPAAAVAYTSAETAPANMGSPVRSPVDPSGQSAELSHSISDALPRIVVDASDVAVEEILQHQISQQWLPLSLCFADVATSRHVIAPSAWNCSLYTQMERTFAISFQGRNFYILTNHRPLTFAFDGCHQGYSSRETRHLAFISEYRTGINL